MVSGRPCLPPRNHASMAQSQNLRSRDLSPLPGSIASANEREEITMNGKKVFVALAVTTALGILGAASAAAGSDRDRGREPYVVPCSLDGVNPVYHPIFLAIRPSPKPRSLTG